MHLLHAVPAMLQLVHDAEDDLAALTGSCTWLRQQSGAGAVAFLAADGQVIAEDGWKGADGIVQDCREALSATTTRLSSTGADALAPAVRLRGPHSRRRCAGTLKAAPR